MQVIDVFPERALSDLYLKYLDKYLANQSMKCLTEQKSVKKIRDRVLNLPWVDENAAPRVARARRHGRGFAKVGGYRRGAMTPGS